MLARGLLDKAIYAYLKGFEADWRDAYTGVNAVTFIELKEPPDPRREQLIPVVTDTVERKIAKGEPDYWVHATRLDWPCSARNSRRPRLSSLTPSLRSEKSGSRDDSSESAADSRSP